MKIPVSAIILFGLLATVFPAAAQSRRAKNYSESRVTTERVKSSGAAKNLADDAGPKPQPSPAVSEPDVIKVETDLVVVPFRVTDKAGRTIADVKQSEVRVFEDGEERDIAYFSNVDQPFTVALVLDMSYSTVFKLNNIQDAAKKFVAQLRTEDRVMVVSFDRKPTILCEPTGDRRILNIAIEGSRVGSGTGLYRTLDTVLNEKLRPISGRKAVVLLSDGVDTTSVDQTAASILKDVSESDAIIYPVKYNTYDDVQKQRRDTAPVQFDEDDRPYTVETKRVKGEREEDYASAKEFLNDLASDTGGRLYNVTSSTNLDEAFANIAKELRKIYSLGYYPSSEREGGGSFEVKVRVYRPNLNIRAKERFLRR